MDPPCFVQEQNMNRCPGFRQLGLIYLSGFSILCCSASETHISTEDEPRDSGCWSAALGAGGTVESSGGSSSGEVAGVSHDVHTSGSGGEHQPPVGPLDGNEDYAQLMQSIALPLVEVLLELQVRVASEDQAVCPQGGTATVNRGLGQVIFDDCHLGTISISGDGVTAEGPSIPPMQSILLAGAHLSLGGDASGEVFIQLAELRFEDPPLAASTEWEASFDRGDLGILCVKSSGETC